MENRTFAGVSLSAQEYAAACVDVCSFRQAATAYGRKAMIAAASRGIQFIQRGAGTDHASIVYAPAMRQAVEIVEAVRLSRLSHKHA